MFVLLELKIKIVCIAALPPRRQYTTTFIAHIGAPPPSSFDWGHLFIQIHKLMRFLAQCILCRRPDHSFVHFNSRSLFPSILSPKSLHRLASPALSTPAPSHAHCAGAQHTIIHNAIIHIHTNIKKGIHTHKQTNTCTNTRTTHALQTSPPTAHRPARQKT